MKTNAGEILNIGKQILKAGGIESYEFDAACLFEHFCGISKHELLFCQKNPDQKTADAFLKACKKRSTGYPLQYILGCWEFYSLPIIVNENVLIPRADTETLVDYILESYSKDAQISVLDMCTGSGCIGLALKKHLPNASVTLCDISDGALSVAEQNAKALGLCVDIKKADLTKGYECYFEKHSFDVIVSNPPYITAADMQMLSKEVKCEPKTALFGGPDGMYFYTALATLWKDALRPCGQMVFEAGYDTGSKIVSLFSKQGYKDIETKTDLNGIVRVVTAKTGNISQ